MKATLPSLPLLLSLIVAHETFLATAAKATRPSPGYQHDTSSQLTLSHPWPGLTDDNEYESESELSDGTASNRQRLRFDPLEALQDGLEVMQDSWFALWVGTWPTAIDWTAAVLDTHLVSSLSTLSKALESPAEVDQYRDVENDLNRFFSQNVAYYFGEDAFSLRNQAYDDMLWVVLGWLESVKFIRSHSERHYCPVASSSSTTRNSTTLRPWQGAQFIEAFGHRARIFYEISSNGWDESLCGGGMVWSPYLGPYKNAITNELFIAASIGMYLYFPGDNNTAPFMLSDDVDDASYSAGRPHDPVHLQNAIRGYDWLRNSNMRNRLGLYVDGFHVTNWRHGGTKCDIRNEQVFTYNQGVVLSALRGLWEGTGNTTYLTDAHELARDVIRATGWSLSSHKPKHHHRWSGVGRDGILEERCDASGRCSQDAQTFKGVFFHHLALLCEPLPLEPAVPGKTFGASRAVAALHRRSCRAYATWVAHNARAAVATRDESGRFGMWWGAKKDATVDEGSAEMDDGGGGGVDDYRNDYSRLLQDPLLWLRDEGVDDELPHDLTARARAQALQRDRGDHRRDDPNERGRGRTVETQSGGIAVLRALWELLHLA